MASGSVFARVALVAAVSVVLGVSTLSPLLKQGTAPDNRIAPAALVAPSAEPDATRARPAGAAVANFTMQEQATPAAEQPAQMAPAAPAERPVAATPPASPDTPSAAPAAAPSAAPAAVPPPGEAAAPMSAAATASFPAVQPTDDASAAATQSTAQAETPESPPIVAATDEPPRKVERRADRPKPKRTRQRAPFSYETQLAAH
jgi:hypothetical protein